MADPASTTAGPGRRSPARIVARIAIVIVLALLLLLVALTIWMRTSSFDHFAREKVLPRASGMLGREVTADSIRGAGINPTRLRVRDLKVAGRKDLPFLTIEEIDLRADVWSFVTSLGERRGLSRLELRGVRLNLLRRKDGEIDLPKPQRGPPSEKPPPHVRRFLLEDGSVRLVDEEKGELYAVDDVRISARQDEPFVYLEELGARAYGGTIGAVGRADLTDRENPSWATDASIRDVNLGAVPEAGRSMRGRLSSEAHLSGRGLSPGAAKKTIEGTIALNLRDAVWEHLSLEDAIVEALDAELAKHGLGGSRKKKGQTGTALGDLKTKLQVSDGWMTITEPIDAQTNLGTVLLRGRIGLYDVLDLRGTARLSPTFISELVSNKVDFEQTVPVRFRVVGTLSEPKVEDVDAGNFGELVPGWLERFKQKLLSPFKKGR